MKLAVLLALFAAAVPCPHPPRSASARAAFRRLHPCPAGVDKGSTRRCRGHVIDHICPIACCGKDDPTNMQWQTTAAAKKKDKVELQCSRFCRFP